MSLESFFLNEIYRISNLPSVWKATWEFRRMRSGVEESLDKGKVGGQGSEKKVSKR